MSCLIPMLLFSTAVSAWPWRGELSKERPVGEHPSGWTIFALIVQAISLIVALATLPAGLPVLPVVAVLAAPWLFTRAVLVPFGWARPAFWLGRTATMMWSHDPVGAGMVAAAMALARSPAPRPDDIAWLERRIQAQSPLLPGGVLAAGLLAWVKGDVDRARRWITFLGWFPVHRVPGTAWAIAREWLMVEAASRGDWGTVCHLGKEDGRRISQVSRKLARAGAVMSAVPGLGFGEVPPPDFGRGALDRALAEKARQAAARPMDLPEEEPALEAGGDPLVQALAAHAAVWRVPRPSQAAVRRLIRAWNLVIDDPAFSPRLAMRAGEIGARDPMEQRRRFIAEVSDELRELAVRAGLPSSEVHLGGGATPADPLRERAISDLEVAVTALRRRVSSERDLPGVDELGEFLEIARLWDQVGRVGGLAAQRLVFRQVQDGCTDMAVRLFNVRKERALANAIFRFLITAGTLAGDQRAVDLSKKNAACGC